MSLRNTINAFCRYCIFDPYGEGSCASQIRACESRDCPLWKVRPGAAKDGPRKKLSAEHLAKLAEGRKRIQIEG